MSEIRKAAVIGAGVMGAGIAAHIANAGVEVLLLDIVPEGATNRSAIAEKAVERLLKAEPAAFMSKRSAKLVKAGNIEDDLPALAECDWIVEAVVERLDVKQALYRKIDAVRKPGTAVSSNTSTIPLAALTEGLSDGFRRDFLITHFFNPPRYMRLLEIVSGPETDPATVARVSAFADVKLGKTVVTCKDTPGFIANRLGTYWMQLAVGEAFALGLTVEEADSVMGRPFGIPKTGVFGLLDLVGLDLMPHVQGSLERALPKDDPFQKTVRDIPLIRTMIETGLIGRKGKGGFYRLNREGGGKVKEAIDLASGSYRREEKARLPEVEAAAKNVGALLGATTPAGRYAVSVMARTLAYAAWLVPAAADDVVAIDDAMRLGYNWKWGPFELIDRIGAPALIAALDGMGEPVPEFLTLARDKTFYRVENGKRQYLGRDGIYRDIVRPEGVLLLSDIKLTAQPVLKNSSAAVWDLGDGVLCFEFTSKSNSLDEGIITLLGKASKLVKDKHKALVIYNEGSNFSVGANLGLALFACNIAAFGEVEKLVAAGQQAYQALKYATFPVVSAPAGMALGGGCEILLHSDAVQAHAESYIGLVECGVGVLPGWGGCKEMLTRWQTDPALPKGPMPAPSKVFEMVSTATVSKSAAEAKEYKFLRESDGITMNRDRLLADAKAKALALAENYVPPKPVDLTLPGPSGRVALEMAAESFHKRGIATKHDLVVASALAEVLTGGPADHIQPVTEAQVLELERAGFMKLIRTNATLARIESVLETGRPLRN
ncbi:putative 3-hydroxyacyl-CoA dehydrogenase [Azorhizobium caulinodans ORS 571]|uniref:Putative 3-hydroxyacyl-CoA dehydrogenase n=1 Tax=Azorhizobium caulinodans (strain ATCC 43989 / DSM 5975 / JCM 20966 / LMG 6465 / NBRC 14845 / NCIMB 13405 / ORS 571) TaxID=438753 RepID=A8IDP7_AZOC5|nr:3-hydroxyacyl-CoA dehydrogenase/enoyl-CoA hydratase family protein [Azorhizobium caulinodans]BAF88971.1 putative 3-hydroxyacyl-CoA dehydrogenase [Azorhizobium caulinodans ORS 571]